MPLKRFAGGSVGTWHVERLDSVTGPSLPKVSRLDVLDDARAIDVGAAWVLRGVTSYQRYVWRHEQEALETNQPQLGRPEATRAALIPIAKSVAWWQLTQDERREIFEESSHHIATGLAVARELHHGRDLGEPFDFLTWFEYGPAEAPAFEELVHRLRTTTEWEYVEREVDIRLARRPASSS